MKLVKINFQRIYEQVREEIPKANNDPRVSSVLYESNISLILDEISKIYFKTSLLNGQTIGNEKQTQLLVEKGLITKEQRDSIKQIRDIRNLVLHSPDLFTQSWKSQFISHVKSLKKKSG